MNSILMASASIAFIKEDNREIESKLDTGDELKDASAL
jgi:hypothetical protein